MRVFRDRTEAGLMLAEALTEYRQMSDIAVLGLPRGGVVVASEVAASLEAPLDALIVKKLGVPMNEELAFGAIASYGVEVINDEVLRHARLSEVDLENCLKDARAELSRREHLYRDAGMKLALQGKRVLIVDDGIATGATMRAAVTAVKSLAPESVIVAVPVAPREARASLRGLASRFVCLAEPSPFWGVGEWFQSFDQVPDDQVKSLLRAAAQRMKKGRNHAEKARDERRRVDGPSSSRDRDAERI